jgi:two-component sensor histidine kinase
MKFKTFQLAKLLLILLFFVVGNLPSFSYNKIQNSNQLNELKKEGNLYEQYRFFHKIIYSPNNQVDNVEEWINYFEKEKEKYTDNNEIVYINFMLVYLYRLDYDLDKAIDVGMSTYYSNINIPKRNKLLCELLRMLEWCYHKKDNNVGLLSINKEKFKVCDQKVVDYYSAYYNMGLYDLALKSYKEHIGFGSKNYHKQNLYDKAFQLNDIGVYYMYDSKIDSALYYYEKSISFFKRQEDVEKEDDSRFMIGIVKGNKGYCFLKKNEFKRAIPFFISEIEGSYLYYKGRNWLGSEKSYSRIALCYIKTNQFKKADKYIKKVKKFKDLYYKLKSEYYSQLKNKDSTLFFKNKYIATSDSIFKTKLMQKDIESLNVLEFNEKIKEQKQKINILEEKGTEKTFQIKLISFTTFIILIFLIFLLYFYNDKTKKQKIVETQKNEIEVALNNNKTLLKELNHRVKNNLQMVSSVISLQSSKITDDNSKKHFKAAINRIKVLSKIHNSLYSKNQLDEIDLLNYVVILKDYLMNSIINPDVKVNYIINIVPGLFINNDQKTTIGLIINELITNSLKYAFVNQKNNLITISIIKTKNYYYFTYTDNGKGFDYDNYDKTKSIGLNLILRLVNQLGEEAEITVNQGMMIKFKFSDKI